MKVCSVCGAKYIDRVSYCFNDGSVLEVTASASPLSGDLDTPAPSLGALPSGSRRGRGRSLLGRATSPGLPGPGLPGPGLAGSGLSPSQNDESSSPEPGDATFPAPDFSHHTLEFLNLKQKKKKKKGDKGGVPAAPAGASDSALPEGSAPTREAPPTPDAPNTPVAPTTDAAAPKPASSAASSVAAAHPSGEQPTPDPSAAPAPSGSSPEDDFFDTPPSATAAGALDTPYSEDEDEDELAAARPAWVVPVVVLIALLLVGGISVGLLGVVGGAAINAKQTTAQAGAQANKSARELPTQPTPEIPLPPPPSSPNNTLLTPGTTTPGTTTPAGEAVGDSGSDESAEPATPTGSDPESTTAPESTPGDSPAASAPAAESNDGVAVVEPVAEPVAPRPPPVKLGTVVFSSSPSGAAVVLNGKARGNTPLTLQLPLGSSRVEMSMKGRKPASTLFNVKSGTNNISLTLEGEGRTGAVMVFMPGRDGDKLFVNGKASGTLPGRATLTEGTHTFTVKGPKGEVVQKHEVKFNAAGTAMVMLSGG